MKTLLIVFTCVLLFSSPAFAQFDMQQIAVLQGARDTLRFGSSLAGVGDLNNDGFEDLAIGQHGSNTFIYFGAKNFDTTADLTFPFFAWHIGHGDINGDSISDLLLTPMGTIYIYYGGTSFDNIPDDSIVNNATYFGWNFACGDINRDGYDDIAVWGADTKVFVYLGGAKISTQPAYILQGPPFYFGFDGLAIGDVNGDGFGDIAVSTANDYNDSTYIYFGGVELDTIPGLKLNGRGVILGDINGDGYKDVITTSGTYFGGTVIDSIVDVGIASGVPPKHTAVGEFNKDIYKDVLNGITTVGGAKPGFILGAILQTTLKIGVIPTMRLVITVSRWVLRI
ncbi:MAG TPA: FG-GAP-like repeat-containing protein [Terriglobales bacterium]|nr:FG-GAP-like repeat-containing protein [Terriglobales bacterium]